jgi:hypothetical protein
MKTDLLVKSLLAIVVICLVKLAFFPSVKSDGILPSAHAESGGVIEWNNALKIVTAGNDGKTTYVWDYEGKTQVRKYSIEGDSLRLTIFTLKGK